MSGRLVGVCVADENAPARLHPRVIREQRLDETWAWFPACALTLVMRTEPNVVEMGAMLSQFVDEVRVHLDERIPTQGAG